MTSCNTNSFMQIILKTNILGLLLILLLVVPSYGLNSEYQESLEKELRYIIMKKPIYVWGGCESEKKGLDCSGYIYLASRRAGLPVKRTTAINMEMGLGGWKNKPQTYEEADPMDIVWWTWKGSTRKHGHVGVFILGPKSRLLEVTHASQTHKGVIIEPVEGSLVTDISSVKKLTIGDKKMEGSK